MLSLLDGDEFYGQHSDVETGLWCRQCGCDYALKEGID